VNPFKQIWVWIQSLTGRSDIERDRSTNGKRKGDAASSVEIGDPIEPDWADLTRGGGGIDKAAAFIINPVQNTAYVYPEVPAQSKSRDVPIAVPLNHADDNQPNGTPGPAFQPVAKIVKPNRNDVDEDPPTRAARPAALVVELNPEQTKANELNSPLRREVSPAALPMNSVEDEAKEEKPILPPRPGVLKETPALLHDNAREKNRRTSSPRPPASTLSGMKPAHEEGVTSTIPNEAPILLAVAPQRDTDDGSKTQDGQLELLQPMVNHDDVLTEAATYTMPQKLPTPAQMIQDYLNGLQDYDPNQDEHSERSRPESAHMFTASEIAQGLDRPPSRSASQISYGNIAEQPLGMNDKTKHQASVSAASTATVKPINLIEGNAAEFDRNYGNYGQSMFPGNANAGNSQQQAEHDRDRNFLQPELPFSGISAAEIANLSGNEGSAELASGKRKGVKEWAGRTFWPGSKQNKEQERAFISEEDQDPHNQMGRGPLTMQGNIMPYEPEHEFEPQPPFEPDMTGALNADEFPFGVIDESHNNDHVQDDYVRDEHMRPRFPRNRGPSGRRKPSMLPLARNVEAIASSPMQSPRIVSVVAHPVRPSSRASVRSAYSEKPVWKNRPKTKDGLLALRLANNVPQEDLAEDDVDNLPKEPEEATGQAPANAPFAARPKTPAVSILELCIALGLIQV